MMGVNAVLWSRMLSTEKSKDGRTRGGEQQRGRRSRWDKEEKIKGGCECVFVEKGAAFSDVGLFFCPSHNLDFLDPLPTSEI